MIQFDISEDELNMKKEAFHCAVEREKSFYPSETKTEKRIHLDKVFKAYKTNQCTLERVKKNLKCQPHLTYEGDEFGIIKGSLVAFLCKNKVCNFYPKLCVHKFDISENEMDMKKEAFINTMKRKRVYYASETRRKKNV